MEGGVHPRARLHQHPLHPPPPRGELRPPFFSPSHPLSLSSLPTSAHRLAARAPPQRAPSSSFKAGEARRRDLPLPRPRQLQQRVRGWGGRRWPPHGRWLPTMPRDRRRPRARGGAYVPPPTPCHRHEAQPAPPHRRARGGRLLPASPRHYRAPTPPTASRRLHPTPRCGGTAMARPALAALVMGLALVLGPHATGGARGRGQRGTGVPAAVAGCCCR